MRAPGRPDLEHASLVSSVVHLTERFTCNSTCQKPSFGRPEGANLVSSVVHQTERFTCISTCQKPSLGRPEGFQRAEMLETRAK